MLIDIDGKDYKLYVKYSYVEKDDKLVEIELPLDEYCEVAWRKCNRLLYYLENDLGLMLKKDIDLRVDFPEVRKQVLHASGMMARLCEDLIIKE